MKYIILTILLISSLLGDEHEWSSDYKEALKIAKKEKKDVYVLITSQSCRWCRKFEGSTLQNERVLEMLEQKYVLVHADRDMDYLPKKFKIKRVPRHYFVTAEGKVIYSFLGYWDELDFRSFLGDVDRERKKKIKRGIIK
ncbi:thioredoxin family protein [Sulfurimonas sp.]|uniref:thioredoxin family protein n=1 Tax=Sulfurimonas sp. TaxID=2022749 RepID=UPI00356511C3